MKKLFVLIAALTLTSLNPAQPANSNTATGVKKESNPRLILPPEKASPVKIPKTDTPVVIDGRPDEPAWQSAAVFKDFIQTYPGDNVEPSRPTEAYMMYDEKHLYLAFKCWDERDKIRATVAKRDGVFGEDNVRIWLDTYNDQRRAYVLGFNPLGIQQDGIHTEGQGPDFSVDIVMESKGVIEEWGWSVEVKIPFKSIRYTAGEGKMWGINLARNIDRFNDEFDSWMPDDRSISGFLIKSGRLTGLSEIKSERTLEIVPSITLSETGKRVPATMLINGIPDRSGRFVNQPIKHDIGVNIKYTITPNITLDAAINPDYAEIEADAPVVTANQRFPIFFSEKRPFFLEGVEIFQSPLRIFHSRTIVDPDYAAKLTGKIGKNSFGFLVASDNAPGNYDQNDRNDPNVRPRIDEFLDKKALFSVLRLKRDIGKEHNIGFFGTARIFPEQRNFLGGFDGRFKINSKTVFGFQVVGSHSRRCFFENEFEPTLEPIQAQRNREICGTGSTNQTNSNFNTFRNYRSGNGVAYQLSYDYTNDTFGYVFEAGGQSKDFRADSGFIQRTDTNFAFGGVRLSTKSKPKSPIIRANWFNGFFARYDWHGRAQDFEWNSNVNLNLQRNTYAGFWGGVNKSRIFEGEFGLKRSSLRNGAFFGDPERGALQSWFGGYIQSQINKKISLGADFNQSFNAFDFDFGAGPHFPRVSPAALANPGAALDPGTGKRFSIGASIQLKPTDPLQISFSFNKSRLVRHDTDLVAFDTNIFSARTTYQFTRFIFSRVRWDYDTLSRNARGQMLFGWNPNPGTAFYVGYNDNLNHGGFNPFTGDHEPGFQRNSRTFFIRASYLFRKSF